MNSSVYDEIINKGGQRLTSDNNVVLVNPIESKAGKFIHYHVDENEIKLYIKGNIVWKWKDPMPKDVQEAFYVLDTHTVGLATIELIVYLQNALKEGRNFTFRHNGFKNEYILGKVVKIDFEGETPCALVHTNRVIKGYRLYEEAFKVTRYIVLNELIDIREFKFQDVIFSALFD